MVQVSTFFVLCSVIAGSSAEGMNAWDDLLRKNLRHTEDARALVQRVEADPKYDDHPVQQLAKVLLEEWSLAPKEPSLQRPRLIFRPPLPQEEIAERLGEQSSSNLAILRVDVACDGSVKEMEVLRGTPYDWLNELIKASFRGALFRPARQGDQYVEATARLHVTWPPRL